MDQKFIADMAEAIARMEGFYVRRSVAQRNNNPGNLRRWGSRPVRDGFAVFDTPEEGFAALRRQIELNISRGLTMREFFGGKPGVYPGYAPASDNNRPEHYARFVASQVGIVPRDPIDIPLKEFV